jgi:hypothetical protein
MRAETDHQVGQQGDERLDRSAEPATRQRGRPLGS